MQNKQELANAIAAYMHRDDLATQIDAIFIPFATKRIGRDLRSQSNNFVIDFDITQNTQELPSNFVDIRALQAPTNNGFRLLRSGTLHEMSEYSRANSGHAAYYQINAKTISLAPRQLGTFKLDYFAEPAALVADQDTNSVLLDYPYLYLYAALVEAFFYTQEPAGHEKALAQYVGEIEKINKQSASARGGSMPAQG